jgi:hypothetical protein
MESTGMIAEHSCVELVQFKVQLEQLALPIIPRRLRRAMSSNVWMTDSSERSVDSPERGPVK